MAIIKPVCVLALIKFRYLVLIVLAAWPSAPNFAAEEPVFLQAFELEDQFRNNYDERRLVHQQGYTEPDVSNPFTGLLDTLNGLL